MLSMLVHNGSNCFTHLIWSVNKWAGVMLPDSLQYVQMVKHLPSEKQLGSPGSWSTSLHWNSRAVTLYSHFVCSRFVCSGTDIQVVMANEGASQSLILLIHTTFLLQQVYFQLGFPGGSEVKESARNAGDLGSIPRLGRSPGEGNGNALQYSCLENPMDGGAWWATVHGVPNTTERLHFLSFTYFQLISSDLSNRGFRKRKADPMWQF